MKKEKLEPMQNRYQYLEDIGTPYTKEDFFREQTDRENENEREDPLINGGLFK